MLAPSTLDVATIDTLDPIDTLAGPAPAAAIPPPQPEVAHQPRWNLATRIGFRFCFLYFSLYVIATQMLGGLLPFNWVRSLGSAPFFQGLISWTGLRVFRLPAAPSFQITGSGDKMVDYLQVFVLLVIAAGVTAVWSLVDRRRTNYRALNKWFRVFLRFSLGTTMLSYGMVKWIPLQMPAPGLQRLLEPYGNFSPMGALWYFIGASKGYEMFAGAMEVASAILLFIPMLATLGAMVSFATAVQIFVFNMAYDVPVKLFSFHLIVMSVALMAPEASRLLKVIVFNRAAGPSDQPPLFRRRWLVLAALALQIGYGAYLVLDGYAGASQSWWQRGGGAPKTALYGIWDIEKMTIDGHVRSPLVTDYGRFRRVIFQTATAVSFQRMDSTFVGYGAKIDPKDGSLTITSAVKDAPASRFAVERPDPQHLILDGQLDGRKIRMETRRFDHSQFLLLTRGFNWIQERPFNR
jgi:hypothetical protein